MASFLLVATWGGKIFWVSHANDENHKSNNNANDKKKMSSVVKVVDTYAPQVLGIEVSLALNSALLCCATELRYLKVGGHV